MVPCGQFSEKNCLAFAIAALCSNVQSVRNIAQCIVHQYAYHLEGAIIPTKTEITTVMRLIKIATTESNFRLPSFFVTYFLNMSRIVNTPSIFITRTNVL